MARRRNTRADEIAPPPDLMHVVTELQRQVTEQQQVINALMNQQRNPATPPVNQNTMPVIPTVVPVPPVPVPTVGPAPVVRQEAYLIQWKRLKPEAYSGNGEPWDAQALFKTVEV